MLKFFFIPLLFFYNPSVNSQIFKEQKIHKVEKQSAGDKLLLLHSNILNITGLWNDVKKTCRNRSEINRLYYNDVKYIEDFSIRFLSEIQSCYKLKTGKLLTREDSISYGRSVDPDTTGLIELFSSLQRYNSNQKECTSEATQIRDILEIQIHSVQQGNTEWCNTLK